MKSPPKPISKQRNSNPGVQVNSDPTDEGKLSMWIDAREVS